MWIKPTNIDAQDWQALTLGWQERKTDVVARFRQYVPDFPLGQLDEIMAGLLNLYYRTEINANRSAEFDIQLRDEFHKGFWVESQIAILERDFPELRQPAMVRYGDETVQGSAADHSMGALVKTFIALTSDVCRSRFGRPYGDNPLGLRNIVLERRAWGEALEEYSRQFSAYKADLLAGEDPKPPEIERH